MSTKGTGRETPETDKFEIAMREKYYAHALGRVFNDALEFARQRECELSEARKHEAVCHCGETLSAHKIYSSCTNFLEMKEKCPNASQNRALLAALKGLVPKCQNTPDRESLEYKECGRPAFYYASFGMHVCEKCATAEQLKRTTPELQAAAAALAAAEPKAEGKG